MGFGPQGAGSDRDLGTAALVGVGIIAVAVLCFVLGHFWTMLLITAAIMLAAVEFFGALHKGGYQPASLVGLAGTFGLLWGSYFRLSWAWPAVLALVLVATLLWFLIVTPGEQTVMNAAVTVLGVVYVGGLGSFAALLAGMDRQLSAAAADTQKVFVWVILAAAVSAVSYDVAGYFFGRSLGRTPLGPALRAASPNKTQEGMIAGVTISIIVTFVVLLIAKLSAFGEGGLSTRTALFAIGCALVAPLGDLCESALKRDLGVKDMGTTLPGHGGALDRFDALLFVLPVAYFVVTSFR